MKGHTHGSRPVGRGDQTVAALPAELAAGHLDLLARLGWWADAERFLDEHGEEVLGAEECARRRRLIREKREIYATIDGAGGDGDDGQSVIGEDDVVEMRKGRVCIAYHLKDADLDIEGVYRSLLRIMDRAGALFGFAPPEVRLVLHGPHSIIVDEASDLPGSGAGRGGAFDGRIRIMAHGRYGDEPQRLAVLVAHEYMHQVAGAVAGGRCPRWLDEGLALVMSQHLPQRYARALRLALEQGRFLPLESLEGGTLFDPAQEASALAYAQAHSLVSYLREGMGWDGVRRLLERCGARGVRGALGECSLNYYLLEREWAKWLREDNAG